MIIFTRWATLLCWFLIFILCHFLVYLSDQLESRYVQRKLLHFISQIASFSFLVQFVFNDYLIVECEISMYNNSL